MYTYKTSDVCSAAINLDVQDGIIQFVEFVGGCNGNTQGIARLVKGMEISDAISRIEGICCGSKTTSCPDQLAKALKAVAGK